VSANQMERGFTECEVSRVQRQTIEYKSYMRSPEWKEKCEQRLEIANHRCEMCGRLEKNSKGLQIHHISYCRLGDEDVGNDLICVCGRCHILIHRYYNRRRK
jgi:predicted HNH restriction endonuclease